MIPTIIESMARALWVDAWARECEERGESKDWNGADLHVIAPNTPRSAFSHAYYLAGQYAGRGNGPPSVFYNAALRADGRTLEEHGYESQTAAMFGHYIAMMAMGHGVSWFDDHAKFPMKEVRCESGDASKASGRWSYSW